MAPAHGGKEARLVRPRPSGGDAAATTITSTAPPAGRPGLFRRDHLLERLAGSTEPLVVVAAPAGYGKTTAVAQWAREDARPTAWIPLHEGDNDPQRLLTRIAQALGARASGGQAGVHALATAVSTESRRLVVLDDVHELVRPPGPELVVQLALTLPPGCQVVLVGRTVAQFRIARLRAQGLCAEFGPAEVAYDAGEVLRALSTSSAPTPTEVAPTEVAMAVLERTEGWPAGVYLSVLASRVTPRRAGTVAEVRGDDAFIADYLREELLDRQSEGLVRFLTRTAPLDQMSAALCDAVLGTTGSSEVLADLAAQNLFVVPLDHHKEWYRYHRLFADALCAELRRREPDEERRVHARAADWFEARGEAERSVAHRLAAGDPLQASRAICRYGAEFVARGRLDTVRWWTETLGDQAAEVFPPMAAEAAWTWALSGRSERARHLLSIAEGAAYEGPMPDRHTSMTAAVALLRAMMGVSGVEQMVVDARTAATLTPPGNWWHPLCEAVLGTAQLLSGADVEGRPRLERVASLGHEGPHIVTALASAQLALLAADRGDVVDAVRRAEAARQALAVAGAQDAVTSVVTYAASARAALARGDPGEAASRLPAAVRRYLAFPSASFPWLAAQVALALGRVSAGLEDWAAARSRVDDACRILALLPTRGTLDTALAQLDEAGRGVTGGPPRASPMALSAAEDRVLRLLPTHLSMAEMGEQLYVSRNTVKSHVTSIYRKLGASGRTDAVTAARRLGLLRD